MEVKQLSYSYNQEKQSLKSVSTHIDKGFITTIIGPNGCGKSTLLGVMSGNYKPGGGEVILSGEHVSRMKPRDLAKQLAIVHQQSEAPQEMTVEKLVSFGRLPHRSMFSDHRKENEDAIEWALKCTNLLAKRTLRIEELSGGERQRIWIAMALAQQTSLLFLDEPTTFLDIYYQYEILDLIRMLNSEHGITIVMVLHDINQAIRYSDQIIVMKDGEIVRKGAPKEVISAPLVKEIYGVDVLVKHEEMTGMYIVPI